MKHSYARQPATMQKPSFASLCNGLLQRKCACGPTQCSNGLCEDSRYTKSNRENDDVREVQKDSAAPPIVHEVLRSSGQPLDPATRAFMEPRFGHSFRDVRVHTDARAAESARGVNALAYVVAHDIVFNTGEYAPQSRLGQKLLAHELTHVVQQMHHGYAPANLEIAAAHDPLEDEANSVADGLLSNAVRIQRASNSHTVQRQPAPASPTTLAGLKAKRVAFNTAGATDPANCAAVKPGALGVDGPHAGANGMEMIFELDGAIPAGSEFDITRTKATGTWERDAAGIWSRLGGDRAGTNDDHHDDDECLTPVGGRIFVVDTPGMGSLDPRGQVFPDGSTISATATAGVRKHSFAEWVIARNRPLGIGWTPISTPLFHRWHSIVSVARLGDVFPAVEAVPLLGPSIGNVFVRADTPSGQHNEIALGSISTTGAVP